MAAVSPPTRNARPLQGGPGIFACGCQGGITHYTLPPHRGSKACARGHPGTPFCGFGLEYSGPWQAPPCSALCRRFCRRWTGGGAGTRPGGKNPPAGWLRGTWGWRRGQYEAAQKTVTRVTALRIVRSGSLLPATQVPVLRSKTEEGTGSIMAETLLAGATSSLP